MSSPFSRLVIIVDGCVDCIYRQFLNIKTTFLIGINPLALKTIEEMYLKLFSLFYFFGMKLFKEIYLARLSFELNTVNEM